MIYLTTALVLTLVLVICGIWAAVTWPLLQWTLAWLEDRRDRAYAELDLDSLPIADLTISPDLRLRITGDGTVPERSTDGAATTVNLPPSAGGPA